MRRLLMPFAISLAMLLLNCNAMMAQTADTVPTASSAQKAPSKWALRRQDREVCTKQATQQNIAKRNLADTVRICMANRQASRKASN